jgi:hypothetical protein
LWTTCPPPTKVEVSYIGPDVSEGVVKHLGIGLRAGDGIVRVDSLVPLVIDVLEELLGCPLMKHWGIDKSATGALGVVHRYAGEREV